MYILVGQKDDFLKRVIPLSLMEMKLSDWRIRRNWVQHWKREYTEIKGALDDFGRHDFSQFKLVESWQHSVGDMLAFIADKLSPQGFDSITANNFRALRDMLGV